MVDVTHDGNNRRAGNEAFDFLDGVRLLFDKHLLGGLFGLVFELDIEPCR